MKTKKHELNKQVYSSLAVCLEIVEDQIKIWRKKKNEPVAKQSIATLASVYDAIYLHALELECENA